MFGDIAGFAPLTAAARRAVKGKRSKAGATAFMANLEKEVLRLERELKNGSYRAGRYVSFQVNDSKTNPRSKIGSITAHSA